VLQRKLLQGFPRGGLLGFQHGKALSGPEARGQGMAWDPIASIETQLSEGGVTIGEAEVEPDARGGALQQAGEAQVTP